MQSNKYELNKEDGVKILKVFGYLLASTTISFLIALLPQLELGETAFLIPIINMVLVTVQKLIKDNS